MKSLPLAVRKCHFLGVVQISHIFRDKNDNVVGVEHTKFNAHHTEDASEHIILAMADIAVEATGANSSHPIFGISSKELQLPVLRSISSHV